MLVDGVSKGAITSYTFNNVTASHTITASFAIDNYTITASADANGTISPSGAVSVISGATTTFTVTPNTGYRVSDVLVDGASVGALSAYTFTNVTANHTISASFEANAPVALTLSGVGITSNTLNTAMEEAATIFFTLNSNATVTLKIIPEKLGPAGTPVYQASQVCPTAGAYMFTWAGKDSTGKVVPDEAYLYILLASDGTNTDTYSPPAPTGTGSITCTQATDYNPYKNVPLTVSYHVPQDARVNISIGSRGILPFKIMNAVPHTIGDYALDWDGRDPSGNFLAYRGDSACSVDSLLRVNYIITSGDTPKITLVKTDPYQMALSYGQFSRIQYNLSRDANVTVTLRSPAGVTVTLISSQYQSAGSHDYTPVNLLDGTDATGKKFVISEEGDYAVSIQAVNPVTGSNSIVKGNIRIGY